MIKILAVIYKIFKNINISRTDSIILSSFILFSLSINDKICTLLNISDEYLPDNIYKETNNQIKKKLHILLQLLNIEIFNTNILDDIINYIKNNYETYKSSDNIIDTVINYHYDNDTNIDVKEYNSFFSNNKLYKWLNDYSKNDDTQSNILYGYYKFSSLTNLNSINVFHKDIASLINMNALMNNTYNTNNIITKDILKYDISNKKYDLIIFDLPNNLTNLIHAQCCEKIKRLKIRGTKSEPLFIQYIMGSLNYNGKACVIVPDHFLFNESSHHVNTRKYLLNNFNIKEIIQIDSNLFNKQCYKLSLLHFENNGKTDTIKFSSLDANFNITNIMSINISTIDSNYILFRNNYIELNNDVNNSGIVYKSLNTTCNMSMLHSESNIIQIPFQYKVTSNISVYDSTSTNMYYLTKKAEFSSTLLDKYIVYYILIVLKDQIKNLIKMNMYDINAIMKLNIPIIPIDLQEKIIKVYDFKNIIIDTNNKQIENIIYIQKNLMDINTNLYQVEYTDLKDICFIHNIQTINKTDDYFSIKKNGLSAGSLSLKSDIDDMTQNNYYFTIKNKKYNLYYVYYWLYNNKVKIENLTNYTAAKSINTQAIGNISIPLLESNIQDDIVVKYKYYDKMIKDLHNTNDLLMNEIMTTL